MYITWFHLGKINNNHNVHMDIICTTLQEFGEKARPMCILWRKASRKIKKEKNVSNPICYALFIENYACGCECIFLQTFNRKNCIFSTTVR